MQKNLEDEIKQLKEEPSKPLPEPVKLRFPTMLRKMWSGGEVQDWLDKQPLLYAEPPSVLDKTSLATINEIMKMSSDQLRRCLEGLFEIIGKHNEELQARKSLTDDEIISDLPDEVTTDALAEIYILGFRAGESHHDIKGQ